VADPDDIEGTLRAFLATYHPEGRRGAAKLGAGDNLWQHVGSLDLLLLVEFIETRFEIRVEPIDFAPQNFSSLAAIAKFVAHRRKPSTS
jgi:hypothetical protein